MAKQLTPQRQRFAREYVVDCNGAHAAERAGYAKGTAKQKAYRLLKMPQIKKMVAGLQKEIAKNLKLDAEYVLKELKENHETAKALKKLADSNRALELIGKHLAMFTDKTEHSGMADIHVHVNKH